MAPVRTGPCAKATRLRRAMGIMHHNQEYRWPIRRCPVPPPAALPLGPHGALRSAKGAAKQKHSHCRPINHPPTTTQQYTCQALPPFRQSVAGCLSSAVEGVHASMPLASSTRGTTGAGCMKCMPTCASAPSILHASNWYLSTAPPGTPEHAHPPVLSPILKVSPSHSYH